MLYWETADQNPSLDDSMLEWAAIWKRLPKVVFSTTLPAVQGNARLASGGLAEEIERLRAEPAEGDIAIGGAALAAEAAALGLIDEYRARVYPVLVGGGVRCYPQRECRVDLELVETRTFSSTVVYLRYRVARSPARRPSPRKNGPASGLTSITQPSSRSERSSRTPGPRPARGSRGGHRRRTSPNHPESAPRRRSTSCHEEIRITTFLLG